MAVEFNEEGDTGMLNARRSAAPVHSSITGIVMRMGIAKTEDQAKYLLLAFALVLFGISIFVSSNTLNPRRSMQKLITVPAGKMMVYPPNEAPRLVNAQ